MSFMVIARAFVLLSLGALAASKEVGGCDRDDMSCGKHAKPNKGAAMFQASMSMQAQPNKPVHAPTTVLGSMAKELMNKSPSQVVGEQVMKLVSPTAVATAPAATATTRHAWSNFTVYSIFIFAVAFMYRKYTQDKTNMTYLHCSTEDPEVASGFAYSLASPERCFTRDRMMCMLSFCCIGIRWADTMRMSGFMSFFSALALVLFLMMFGSLTLGAGFLLLVGMAAHYRGRLRAKFNIPMPPNIFWQDVLTYVFCPFCAISQEARQIEEAYLARHPAILHMSGTGQGVMGVLADLHWVMQKATNKVRKAPQDVQDSEP